MSFIIIGIIVLIIVFSKIQRKTVNNEFSYFLESFPADVPDGQSVFMSTIEVSGIFFRKQNANKFIDGINHCLEFEKEPTNEHDKNAIKIIGVSNNLRYFIGYLPKEISLHIAEKNLFELVTPSLSSIRRSRDGYIEVIFRIIGPKKLRPEFREWVRKNY
jgi:hypothetical protein